MFTVTYETRAQVGTRMRAQKGYQLGDRKLSLASGLTRMMLIPSDRLVPSWDQVLVPSSTVLQLGCYFIITTVNTNSYSANCGLVVMLPTAKLGPNAAHVSVTAKNEPNGLMGLAYAGQRRQTIPNGNAERKN